VSKAYNDFYIPISSRAIDPLLEAAGVVPGVRAVDVATGPGAVASRCLERGASVIGVDISEDMVALGKRLHPEVEFLQAPAEDLPFRGSTFDAVTANFLVPHMAEPETTVSELIRIMKPEGRLALTTWDIPADNRLLGIFYDAIGRTAAKAPPDIPRGPPMFRLSVDREFADLLIRAGLESVHVRTIKFHHLIESAEAFWEGTLASGVRTPVLILSQPEAIREGIRTAFDELVRQYQVADGQLDIPVSIKLGSGQKKKMG
jgi:SAM-dependent methyltransferase